MEIARASARGSPERRRSIESLALVLKRLSVKQTLIQLRNLVKLHDHGTEEILSQQANRGNVVFR